jgi:hypothetical protein
MNKLLVVAVVSIFSTINAQSSNYDANVAQRFEEMNNPVIQEEGITADNGSYTLSGRTNVMPTTTIHASQHHQDTATFSVKKTETELTPKISDAEIAKIDSVAESYKWARIMRLASSKSPSYSIEALRSIHGNETTVQAIAYDRNLPRVMTIHKNIFKTIASLFAKKQTQTETQIANGY